MRVLVIGNGSREHTLAWKLRQSPSVEEILIAPGNPGTAEIGKNLPVAAGDLDGLVHAAREHHVDLTVVGPEAPLAAGVVDRFQEHGLTIAGPTQAAARIESSKSWAKEVMNAAGVPTPRAERFSDFESARDAAIDMPLPLVIKADGLAAGKGVVVAQSHQAAVDALHDMMVERTLGDAADEVLLEEYLTGLEVSMIGVTDGATIYPLLPACDYKRALDGDQGPNTGGMGTYCPVPSVDPELMVEITRTVLQPTINEMHARGVEYRGVLYAGMILTQDGPRVLEFNCRFGDPEAQVVLPLMDADLAELFSAAASGNLGSVDPPKWHSGAAVGVVMASGGYPGSYRTGVPIYGLDNLPDDCVVFQAGTALDDDGTLVTAGGRVLTVTSVGQSFSDAREQAYRGVAAIQFSDAQFRQDIGLREVAIEA